MGSRDPGRVEVRIEKVSIDEMARDARTLAGEDPRASASLFTRMLRAYGWRVAQRGRVMFVGRNTVLEDWQIERAEVQP